MSVRTGPSAEVLLRPPKEWPSEAKHIYDSGPAERFFPPDELGLFEQRQLFAEARNWLMPVLCRGDEEHPLGQLWHRKDWLASCELLSLAMNLRRLRGDATFRDFLRNARKKVCGTDPANRAGHWWEFWCAATLHHPGQRVRPPGQGEPGFDLWVAHKSGANVRVSCKALEASDNEKAFRRFCHALQARIETVLPNEKALQIIMVLQREREPDDLDPQSVFLRVAECLRRATDKNQGFTTGGWYMNVGPFVREATDLPFAQTEPSYSLVIASEYPKDEQVRFFSLLDRAIANLSKHCSQVGNGVTNALFVRVPPPISMKEARAIIESKLGSDTAHISMVALHRTQLSVKNHGGGGVQLAQEYLCLHNPHAAVPLPADFDAELPIGVRTGAPRANVT